MLLHDSFLQGPGIYSYMIQLFGTVDKVLTDSASRSLSTIAELLVIIFDRFLSPDAEKTMERLGDTTSMLPYCFLIPIGIRLLGKATLSTRKHLSNTFPRNLGLPTQ